MQSLRISLITISFILSIQICFSQRIDIENFNHNYLEHLIKTGIDSLRTSEGLQPLQNDSILYNASRDHALYMKGTNILDHTQKDNPQKETPHQRIVLYGGNFSMTAENIAFTYIYLPLASEGSPSVIIVTDYKDLAAYFVQGWKNSPGHYRNIMRPEYNRTGVAVSYNPLTQIVFGVQKFGR